MAREVDVSMRPGFCLECFCEKCMRGFYTTAKAAIKIRNGYACAEPGCAGVVHDRPLLSWKRLKPCKDGCARLRKQLAAGPT